MEDDHGHRRGPSSKFSWTTALLRKPSAGPNGDRAGADGVTDSPKTGNSRPVSLNAATFGGLMVPRTASNLGLSLNAGPGNPVHNSGKEGGGTGVLNNRSHSVVHTGLLGPGQATLGNAADVVMAVKDLRKRSTLIPTTSQTGPPLQTRTGSLSTYFYAPNPTPGAGVCFSPDGEYVMRWGYGTDVKLLSTDDGLLVTTMVGPSPGQVRYATFNHDGSKVAAATDDCRVYVWVTANKYLLCSIDVGAEPLAHIVFARDDKHILSCDDEGQLELWSLASASMVHRYDTGHNSKRCGFSGDGESVLSCAGDDCGLVMLDVRGGGVQIAEAFEEVSEARNRASYVISPDGTKVLLYIVEQVYGSVNLVLYSTTSDTHIRLQVCDGAVTHADFSNDSSLFITAGRDDLIHVWESDTGELRTTLEGHTSDVLFCKISEDGEVAISGDSEGNVLVWALEEGLCAIRLQAHTAPMAYVDINADGTRALTVDSEGHAFLWYLDAARMFEVLRQHSDLVCCLAPTPDGSALVVGYKDGCLRSWNVTDGPGFQASVTWTHAKQGCPVEQLCMRPDGMQVASAGRDGSVLVTDLRRGLVVATLAHHTDFVTGLVYSERSDILVSATRVGEVAVWNARSYGTAPIRTLEVPDLLEVAALALNPQQSVLAAATAGGTVHVWSTSTWASVADVKVTELPATKLCFNADGSVLAVGSADGGLTLVDPISGTKAAHYSGNASSINNITFLRRPEHILLSLCGRQAITWDCFKSCQTHITDFIADESRIFSTESMGVLPGRVCVAHDAVVLYDPHNHTAMYDMMPRPPEQHPGNSYLFRDGTTLCTSLNGMPLALFCAPDTTVHMLAGEDAGTRCLDFSSDGRLLVSGNLRGEVTVYDVVHQEQMYKWSAHRRYAITCVKFTHDATAVYSCAEDCKVIMWDWRRQGKLAVLTGHQSPVASVDMSVDGTQMASGDRDGFIFIWDTVTHTPKQVITAHEGAVLCCSLSPCGTMVATTGADEHIVILNAFTGEPITNLDDAMDGKGLTIKFSFDGTRLQVGGEKGNILIWDVARNCLLYDIAAHDGKVFDCGWSGDSRRLLSVGSDGKARLWDVAAGSELCQANFERVMGAVESGGFVRCDLSATGSRMAGCTAKGQLIDWDVGAELRCVPEGSMLYKRMSSMSLSRAKDVYARLLRQFPLLANTQDSRGWTILMHAVANSNPEITKLIINSVPPMSAKLGLTASAVQNSILSSIRHVPRIKMLVGTAGMLSTKRESAPGGALKRGSDGGTSAATPRVSMRAKEGAGANGDMAAAAAAAVGSGQESPPPLSLLGKVGTFLRGSAELRSPGGGQRSSATGEGTPTSPLSPSSPRRPPALPPLDVHDLGPGSPNRVMPMSFSPNASNPIRVTASLSAGGPVAEATVPESPDAAALPFSLVTSSNPSPSVSGNGAPPIPFIPSDPGSITPTGTRTAILKAAAVAATGGRHTSLTSSAASNTSAAATSPQSHANSATSAAAAAAGASGYGHGRRSLLGAILDAEHNIASGSRRRRSLMLPLGPALLGGGGGGPSPPASQHQHVPGVHHGSGSGGLGLPHPGGPGGEGGGGVVAHFGRSVRYAMHKLTHMASPALSRDLEDGASADDGMLGHHGGLVHGGGWRHPLEGLEDGKAGMAKQDTAMLTNRSNNKVWPEPSGTSFTRPEPNAVRIALEAGAADCVQHVLDAVLAQKVTPGSYHAITAAIPAVAAQYPTMCQTFLTGLPLRPLGEMEVPSAIAARGMVVTSAGSYTSYKEMWTRELGLQGYDKGPMALMEACMVRLPFAASSGKSSVLHTLVESSVPVQTFGSDTVKAIVDYKWRSFAQRRIYVKALVYLLFTVLFTIFAVLFADDDSTADIQGLYDTPRGVAMVTFAGVLFVYGTYFLVLECVQLVSLGPGAYFDSFWNIVDIAAYVTTLVVCPCTVFRYGIGQGQFVPVLIAAEIIMLWVKVLFYGLAIDGVGTFIFMTAEIIKGLKYFIGLLATLFISFAVAFMVLFRNEPANLEDGSEGLGRQYGDIGNALLNVYLVMFTIGDPHAARASEYSHFAILLFCVYMFALLVVLLNMLITLMADIYKKVKGVQHFVFLKGRAELIIDVESTSGGAWEESLSNPYLHLLMPLRKDAGAAGEGADGDSAKLDKLVTAVVARMGGGDSNGGGGAAGGGGGGGGGVTPHAQSMNARDIASAVAAASANSDSDEDGGGRLGGAVSRMASFKSNKSFALVTGDGGASLPRSVGGGALARRMETLHRELDRGATMVRRPGGLAASEAAGQVERLERAMTRLNANVEVIMAHLKLKRVSVSGGGDGVSPARRVTGGQRPSVVGIGGVSMAVRPTGAGGRPVALTMTELAALAGTSATHGMRGGASRSASRVASRAASRAPSRPVSASPLGGGAGGHGGGILVGPGGGGGGTGLHATFADDFHTAASFATLAMDLDAGNSPGGGGSTGRGGPRVSGASGASVQFDTAPGGGGGRRNSGGSSVRASQTGGGGGRLVAAAAPTSPRGVQPSGPSATSATSPRQSVGFIGAASRPSTPLQEQEEEDDLEAVTEALGASLAAMRSASATSAQQQLQQRGPGTGSGSVGDGSGRQSATGGPGGVLGDLRVASGSGGLGGLATAARLVLDPMEQPRAVSRLQRSRGGSGGSAGGGSGQLGGSGEQRVRTPGEVEQPV